MPRGQWRALEAYNRVLSAIARHRIGTTYFGAAIECDLLDFIQRRIFHFGVWEISYQCSHN